MGAQQRREKNLPNAAITQNIGFIFPPPPPKPPSILEAHISIMYLYSLETMYMEKMILLKYLKI